MTCQNGTCVRRCKTSGNSGGPAGGRACGANGADPAVVSVVVPVLAGQGMAGRLVEHLQAVSGGVPFELIIADGDPQQPLPQPDCLCGAAVLHMHAPIGRARQMNAAAACARGRVLLFLHADTRLPHNAFAHMLDALSRVQAGAFSLGIDGGGLFFRLTERVADARNRLTRTPYGDQAQFFCTAYFRQLGGYADIPLMEDVDIMRRIRRRGDPIEIVKSRVATSARRWHKEGLLYCSARNVCLRALYALGVSPHSLSRWYRAHRG